LSASDRCVATVLALRESAQHPHLNVRGTFTEHDGSLQSVSTLWHTTRRTNPGALDAGTVTALKEFGIDEFAAVGAAVAALT
jgi:alpha-methylacyl-CoA racemase